LLTAVGVILTLALAADAPVIAPSEATDHVGQDVVVRGTVAQVNADKDGHTLFLNFGSPYPDQVFNAVILSRNLPSFPEARSWEGKVIEVRGRVELYKGKGKPEILLERPDQVTVESGATPPQGGEPHGPEVEGGFVRGVAGGTHGGIPGDVVASSGTGPVMDYDSPPKPLRLTKPLYPQDAFVARIEGTVLLEILIDSSGRVVRARVIQSVPMLDAAALQTVSQWQFQPAVKHGRPVATIAQAPISFRIYDKRPAGVPERKQRE